MSTRAHAPPTFMCVLRAVAMMCAYVCVCVCVVPYAYLHRDLQLRGVAGGSAPVRLCRMPACLWIGIPCPRMHYRDLQFNAHVPCVCLCLYGTYRDLQLRAVAAALRKSSTSEEVTTVLATLKRVELLVRARPDELDGCANEITRALLHCRVPEWAEQDPDTRYMCDVHTHTHREIHTHTHTHTHVRLRSLPPPDTHTNMLFLHFTKWY